jgi:DNA-binding MarR family transcriptional regulator
MPMIQIPLETFADEVQGLMQDIVKGFLKRESNDLIRGRITMPQFFVLSCLQKKDRVKMSEIAGFLRVTTAAATQLVDRLVRSGHVARDYDPADRRVIRVRLTAKGSRLVQEVRVQKRQSIIEIFGKMSEKEREDYLRILQRIHGIVGMEEKEQ